MTDAQKPYRIWYVHNVPRPMFEQEFDDLATARAALETLYLATLFLFNAGVIPDYANAGGIERWVADENEWVEVDDDETEADW